MIGVGDRIPVRCRAVAHGGSMLADIPGDAERRTVFVRHALPGEEGEAVVTGVRRRGLLVDADLVVVSRASPDRVAPPCPYSAAGGCGGCDFQHASLPAQRALKADVVRDCLRRIARLDPDALPWDGLVHAVPGDEAGLRWRTRSRFLVAGSGLAMRGRRASRTVPIADCLIAMEDVVSAARRAAADAAATSGVEVWAVRSSTGEALAGVVGSRSGAPGTVGEAVGGRVLRVRGDGFWQVHPGAAGALADDVAAVLRPRAGESLLDLYGGVGLFAAALADDLAPGAIHVVEGDAGACAMARRNLAGIAGAAVHTAAVLPWLQAFRGPADLVVLDPPRSGAGGPVLRELHRLAPRAVAYVACDPAALARDLRTVHDLGWRLESLRAHDMFPMTHHVECVAGLVPPQRD